MSSFADLMKNNSINNIKNNEIVEGKIIGKVEIKGQSYHLVDAGLKSEGIVSTSEVIDRDLNEKMKFFLIGEKENYYLLSYEKAKKEIHLREIKQFYKKKEQVEVKIVSQSNEGYKVLIFDEIPGILLSQETFEIGSKQKAFINRIFNNGSVHLSMVKGKNNTDLQEGSIVQGTVISFNDYFVFVALKDNDTEAIIHFNDLSWEKINFPSDVISQGQTLQLKVLKIQNKCIYLSLKQTKPNPWQKVKEKFIVNNVYEGKIKEINDYELIVDLEDGLTGSIHVSEISWSFKKGSSLVEEFKIGEKIKFYVIEIDAIKRRIRLSIKQLLPNPFFKFAEDHKEGDIIEGVVLNDHVTFGSFVFIGLSGGVDGMLHKSELDWDPEEGLAKFTDLEKGKKIKVKIVSIDKEKMRVSVSVKRLVSDIFEEAIKKTQIGKNYECEVVAIFPDGLKVKFEDNFDGFIRRSDLSNERSVRINNFSIGSKIKAKLISVHNQKRVFLLSIKAQQIDENKNVIKSNNNTISTSSFGEAIK
ncbi:MAG: S1 RNA-binding domain-containing protein [Bacteroidota bacterium]